jgi:2-polyprenyl-3-methyl-5-hydroxy-6-metoxy-1,4-benzoquinol methylase
MRDWRQYWNHADQVFDDEPLRQVGKTVRGQVIEPAILDAIVADIVLRLDLGASDSLLDLCCGNGLITSRIAAHCRQVVGVDFSRPLIDVANRQFGGANIQYLHADVSDLPEDIVGLTFGKFLMYEAVQHLDSAATAQVLDHVARLGQPGASFYIGSIPDQDRIWRFYDTPERRLEYEHRRLNGTDAIGHWWKREQLVTLARCHGFDVDIFERTAASHGAHYRFDALCVNRGAGAAC